MFHFTCLENVALALAIVTGKVRADPRPCLRDSVKKFKGFSFLYISAPFQIMAIAASN